MKWVSSVILFCALASASAFGQPFTLDKDIQAYRLDLTPAQHQPGSKAVGVQGVTVAKGHYFYVKGHGMTQPIDVILESPDDADLRLDIHSSTWSEPVLSASTGHTGLASHRLTAYGEFGVRVSGPAVGTPYLLSVVAQPEVAPQLASPFKPVQTVTADTSARAATAAPAPAPAPAPTLTNAPDSDDQSVLIYVVIGLLIVVIGLLAALLRKKPGAAIILLGTCSAMGTLLPPPAALAVGETSADYDEAHLRLRAGGFQQPPPASSWGGMSTEQADKVWEGGAKTIEYLNKLKEGWEAYQALDSCMRIDSPPNMPLVPSYCDAEGDGGSWIMNSGQSCSQCFTASRMAFNKARLDLEKLRVIYSCTKKMSDAAIAAGDSMSGIHGYSGVIWQGMRFDIAKSVEKMQNAYDQKYPELMQNLQSSMVDMAVCEAQAGTPDWYDRFGFMYFEFMRDAYRRKD